MNTSTFLFLCLGLLAGAALGVGGYVWYLQRQASAKMRLPSKWPLTSRVLMTNEEYEVFKWLMGVFHDHLVMVKLPVLRLPYLSAKTKTAVVLAGKNCWVVCTALLPFARPMAMWWAVSMYRASAG